MGFHGVPGTESSIPSEREKEGPGEAQAAGGWSAARKAKDGHSQPRRPSVWAGGRRGLPCGPAVLAQRGCSPTRAGTRRGVNSAGARRPCTHDELGSDPAESCSARSELQSA